MTTTNIKSGIPASSPETIDFLSPVEFRLAIDRIPNTIYFSQAVTLPGVEGGTIRMPTPLLDNPIFGDKLTFSPFVIEFKVDEGLNNYNELLTWKQGLYHPDTLDQFKRLLLNSSERNVTGSKAITSVFSDGRLLIMNSNKNVAGTIHFESMFPVSLDPIRFDTREHSVEYVTIAATFAFLKFSIDN